MSSHINDELNRLQSTFNTIITEISHQTQHGRQLGEQRTDEETPITNITGANDASHQAPEMPGAFTFNHTSPNNLQSLETQGAGPPVLATTFSHGINKVFSLVFTTLMIILFVPLYVFYRLIIYMLFLTFSIAKKVHRHGYRSMKNNDPVNTARRFALRFDERIGNKDSTLPADVDPSEGLQDGRDSGDLIREDHLTEIERPDFLECSYSNALFIVKKQKRWLLVYIESEASTEATDFTRDVLINKRFLSFIKERDILVWGGDVADSEAYQACNQFNITRLPFLGLFCLTVNQIPTSSGMQQSAPVLSLVAKIQGYWSLNPTMKKLDQAYRKYNPALSRLRLMNRERSGQPASSNSSEDSTLQAYRELRHNSSILQPTIQSLERTVETQYNGQNAEALKLDWLKWRKSKLKPECTSNGEFSRIAIRLPDGSRKQFKFDKTASIEEIYAYVECVLLHDIEVENNAVYTEPAAYLHEYSFQLTSVLPKETVPVDTATAIESVDYLYPSGNLLVDVIP
jgi:FAS-associated factor 2